MSAAPWIGTETALPGLGWAEVVAAIEAGHRRPKARLADSFLGNGTDTLLSRAAWIDGMGSGVKSVTVCPANPGRDLPSVQGAMLVFAPEDGRLRAIIDSAVITRWKTAADSVLGAKLLARPDAHHLLIVGAGAVAESLIDAYRAILPQIGTITVWNRTEARAEALAARRDGITVAPDLAEAVGAADIIATATMARSPVIRGEWLRPGSHLDLIGAFRADMREADDAALQAGRLFVDSRDTTLDHIGELMMPLASGAITRETVRGDLYDLIGQGAQGRRNAEEITIFKNGGGAHLDLMTAEAILNAAGY